MANNIKGITIQLDANPQPLEKALRDVDSKAKSLQTELRQINSQLKFDPHNAVLLQQKFQVLSERVQTTREKLKQLEDAQEEVERQFQNGEIDEGQYRAFQREVEQTKNQLKNFEKECDDAKKDIDNLGKETDQTGDEFTEMGDKAQTSSKKVDTGLNTTAINMSAFTNIVRNIGSAIQNAIRSAIELGKKIAGVVKDYLDRADEINTNAKKYGIDTATLQKWEYASEIVDVSSETMARSMAKITRSLNQWRKGNKTTIADYEKLGVAVTNANGTFRSQEDIFYDVIDALGKMDDEVEADIMANQLFGRSFQEIEPLIVAGSDAIKDLGQEAEDMGLIMPQEQLDNLNYAKDSLDKLEYQLGVVLAPIIEALAPYIEKFANWISEKLASPKAQEVIGRIAEAVGEMAEALANGIIDFVESGQMEELIDVLIDALPVITDFIKNSLPALLGALKEAIGFMSGLSKSTQDFDTKLKNLTKDEETFGSKGEFTAGLLKKAFTGGFSAIGDTASTVLDQMGVDADSLEGKFLNSLFNMKLDFTSIFSQVSGIVGEKMNEAMGKVKQAFEDAWTNIKNWFNRIGDWFKELPDKIWNWIKSIPDKIAKAFSGKATVTANGQIGYRGGYAEGGIFKKSSFVNIGEAGPEVVLPLDKLGQVLSSVGYSGGSIVVNAPVQVVKELNDSELNRVGGKISDIVGRQFARRTGGVL